MQLPPFKKISGSLLAIALMLGMGVFFFSPPGIAQDSPSADSAPPDPERTSFQTGQPWDAKTNLGTDSVMVYGIDAKLPDRIRTWRDHGYATQVMTGVAWGNYQDYLYGRFDGIDHQDEAQTDKNGNKIGHGGDVYYMVPGINYGKFLCVGVQRALDAGAGSIYLEEPEFWDRAG
jgi:hypothetical protein